MDEREELAKDMLEQVCFIFNMINRFLFSVMQHYTEGVSKDSWKNEL